LTIGDGAMIAGACVITAGVAERVSIKASVAAPGAVALVALAQVISYDKAIEQLEREILKVLQHWDTSDGSSQQKGIGASRFPRISASAPARLRTALLARS
jgi:hypothetical protein